MKTLIAAALIAATTVPAFADNFNTTKGFFGSTYEYTGATDSAAVRHYLAQATEANETALSHIKGEGEASVYYKPELGRVVVKTSKHRFDVRELSIIREFTSRDLFIGELFVINSNGVLKEYRKVYANPEMSRGGVRWKALRAHNQKVTLETN